MSNSIFIVAMLLIGFGLYFSISRKWKKREEKINSFAYDIQRELQKTDQCVTKGIDYYKLVQEFYTQQGYTISKHPDFVTDFILKKEKEITFVRIQSPGDHQSITAKSFQTFVGQTVLYALDNPLYASYALKWSYVCSKMMCDQSAKIFISKHEDKLRFELIDVN